MSATEAAGSGSGSGYDQSPPRALVLGLGGGLIPAVLLEDFPHLVVDTVDFSEDVARAALGEFGLHRSVCKVLKMQQYKNGTVFETIQYSHPSQAAMDTSKFKDFACRSYIIIANAWEYIRLMANRIKSSTMTRGTTYDFIVHDLAEISAVEWTGEPGKGKHVSKTIITDALQAFGDLLTPGTGIGIFRITIDELYASTVQTMIDVFGLEQVVSLRVKSNDCVVVVARDKYQTAANPDASKPRHPCTNPAQFALEVEQFAESITTNRQSVHSTKYSLFCADQWANLS